VKRPLCASKADSAGRAAHHRCQPVAEHRCGQAHQRRDRGSFAVDTAGNLILGRLRSGSRTLDRVARISQNYAGERMVILGMPGKGKSQLVRSLLSQAMGDNDIAASDDARDDRAEDSDADADQPF
jgi:hypothetical protein